MGRDKQGAPGSPEYWPSQVLLLQVCATNTGLWRNSWSGPWETVATGNGGHAKGFFRAYACAAGVPGLCTAVFCSYLEAQYFVVLLERLYSSNAVNTYQTVHQEPLAVTLLLGTSVNFFPHSARARASAFHFFFFFFSFPPEVHYKKNPNQPEKFNVDSKIYLLLLFTCGY